MGAQKFPSGIDKWRKTLLWLPLCSFGRNTIVSIMQTKRRTVERERTENRPDLSPSSASPPIRCVSLKQPPTKGARWLRAGYGTASCTAVVCLPPRPRQVTTGCPPEVTVAVAHPPDTSVKSSQSSSPVRLNLVCERLFATWLLSTHRMNHHCPWLPVHSSPHSPRQNRTTKPWRCGITAGWSRRAHFSNNTVYTAGARHKVCLLEFSIQSNVYVRSIFPPGQKPVFDLRMSEVFKRDRVRAFVGD